MNSYLPTYLKKKNRTLVLDLFLEHKELTRPDITRMTGISLPTVMKIAEFMISKDILIEDREHVTLSGSGLGRKSQLLRLNPNAYSTIGIYFEGNALRIGLVNMAFEVVEQKSFPLKPKRLSEDELEILSYTIMEELRRICDHHPETNILGVGFALPGIVDCENMKIQKSRNYLYCDDFYKMFPAFKGLTQMPLYLENDMNAASLGEMIQRKLFSNGNLIYLSLGTGFGSGIIMNSEIWHGASYFAGNVAKMVIPYMTEDGLRYETERCVEDYICQSELQTRFDFDLRYKESCSGEKRKEVIHYISQYLVTVINNLSYTLDISDFVLAGLTVEYFGEELYKTLGKEMARLYNPSWARPEIRITPPVNGNEGIVGAAYIAFSNCIPELLAETI